MYGCMVIFKLNSDDSSIRFYCLVFSVITGVLRGIMSALSMHESTSFVTQMLLLITKELVPFLAVYMSGIIYF